MTDAVLDRARGVLLGVFIGDSLGAQVEFSSAETIRQNHPDGVRELTGGGPHGILPGQVTDDGELTLALARSLVDRGDYVDDLVAQSYIDWYNSHPFDIGGTTSRALSGTRSFPPAKSLRLRANPASQANGSLMRISPVAIMGVKNEVDFDVAAEIARADSTLTHPSEVCQEACAAYVTMIRSLVLTQDPENALRMARNDTRSDTIFDVLSLDEAPKAVDGSKQGWVLFALQLAVWTLKTSGSFEDGLVEIINCGGDTDTNAAIAGGLLGAFYGASQIPDRWKNVLLNCKSPRPKHYHANDALELADRLAEL